MSEEKKPLILIADRQLGTLISLDALLSHEGYRVTTCSSSDAALRAVAWQKLDLVIEGRVGPERHATLVSKIKTLSPDTNVLILVEPNDDSIVAESIAAGADCLLRRPYSESQVIEKVNRLLHVVQT
jgi:DNA-binding NarL/FixJ family response regulator